MRERERVESQSTRQVSRGKMRSSLQAFIKTETRVRADAAPAAAAGEEGESCITGGETREEAGKTGW